MAKYKDQELIVSDTISLFSRFRYVYKYSEPEDQRFTRPIALVRAKYPTMPDNTPKYNPNLKGAYGVVRTHPFLPIPAVLYIELGEAAYQNENQLASTWIHENVHLDQGRETIRKIAAGRKLYERHDAAGTDLSTIPQADKDSIHNWIVGESEAYFAEQSAYEETCLNAEGRKGVEKQLKQFSNIYHAMRN